MFCSPNKPPSFDCFSSLSHFFELVKKVDLPSLGGQPFEIEGEK